MNIDYDKFEEANRCSQHWIKRTIDTDTYVGESVLFFDNKPLLLFTSYSRKSKEDIYYLDKELLKEFISFLSSCIDINNVNVKPFDINTEYLTTYQVRYPYQILSDTGYYKNECVKIHKEFSYTDVKIEYQNEIISVPISELYFYYNQISKD